MVAPRVPTAHAHKTNIRVQHCPPAIMSSLDIRHSSMLAARCVPDTPRGCCCCPCCCPCCCQPAAAAVSAQHAAGWNEASAACSFGRTAAWPREACATSSSCVAAAPGRANWFNWPVSRAKLLLFLLAKRHRNVRCTSSFSPLFLLCSFVCLCCCTLHTATLHRQLANTCNLQLAMEQGVCAAAARAHAPWRPGPLHPPVFQQ